MNSLPESDPDRSLRIGSRPQELYTRLDSFVESLEACRGDEDILSLLRGAAESLGATSSYFATFGRDAGVIGSLSLLLACDPLWGLEYEREACFASDPWLAYSRVSSEPVRASEIGCRDNASKAVVRRAEGFGFRSAIVAPAPAVGSSDLLGMLVLGHSEVGHFERAGRTLAKVAARTVAMELREKRAALARRRLVAEVTLSCLEVELLRLARNGLSSKAIARAVGLSASAVDMRFHRLNRKMRCRDRKTASHFAALCGLA